ncbi:MAG: phage portal protein family protein [Shewanella sp.]
MSRTRRSYKPNELATLRNDPFYRHVHNGLLHPRDAILAGGGPRAIDKYSDLLLDPHTYACIDKQLSTISTLPWTVEPGGEEAIDKQCADFVKTCLEQLGQNLPDSKNGQAIANASSNSFDSLCRSMGFGWIISYSVAEVIWYKKDLHILAQAIKPRDQRRFRFWLDDDGDILLRLLTDANSFDGEPCPARKFIVAQYYAVPTDDPYGLGLGRLLYYPVKWKQDALFYWASLLEQSAFPSKIGTVPEQATDEQMDEFWTNLEALAENTTMVMREGFSVDFKQAGLAGAKDALQSFLDYCDKVISLIILGEATTGEKLGGSQAREEINNSIRMAKAKALSDYICSVLSASICTWLQQINYPKAKPPRLKRIWPDETEDADLMTKAVQAQQIPGLRVDANALAKEVGLPVAQSVPKKGIGDALSQLQKLQNKP